MIGITINLLDDILGPWHTLQAWAIPVQINISLSRTCNNNLVLTRP